MAEVLGRYSKLSETGLRVENARLAAEAQRRVEPWMSPELTGAHRVRAVLKARAEEIRARYEAGGTCQGLARLYGVSESTMRDFFRRPGIVIRPLGTITAADVSGMVQLRAAGWTYREIGDKYGVTRQAVARRLRRGPTC